MAMVGNTDTSARNSNRPLPLLRVGRSGGRSHLLARGPHEQNSPSLRHADFIQSNFMAWPVVRPVGQSHKVAEGVDHTGLERPRPSACRIGPGLVFCLLSKPRVQRGAGISLSIQNGDGFGVPGQAGSAGSGRRSDPAACAKHFLDTAKRSITSKIAFAELVGLAGRRRWTAEFCWRALTIGRGCDRWGSLPSIRGWSGWGL
jgi:hypothetical protein